MEKWGMMDASALSSFSSRFRRFMKDLVLARFIFIFFTASEIARADTCNPLMLFFSPYEMKCFRLNAIKPWMNWMNQHVKESVLTTFPSFLDFLFL